ncbi:hypothetical protein B0H14DRAFT_2592137 [Mycena olivaceomarginata]|nr:hypothetical protein B0H14DRAFT_2592137 [Mycena olivaceomarginata]
MPTSSLACSILLVLSCATPLADFLPFSSCFKLAQDLQAVSRPSNGPSAFRPCFCGFALENSEVGDLIDAGTADLTTLVAQSGSNDQFKHLRPVLSTAEARQMTIPGSSLTGQLATSPTWTQPGPNWTPA